MRECRPPTLRLGLLSACALLGAFSLTALPLSAQQPAQASLRTTGGIAVPGGSFTSPVIFENNRGPCNGWAFTVCHDAAVLEVNAVDLGIDGSVANNGASPEFIDCELFEGGWGCSVLFSALGSATLPEGVYEIGRGYYEGVGVGTTSLCPCTLGSPPISTVIVYGAVSIAPELDCGTVEVVEGPYLIRGDANFDGVVDRADGGRILNSLFLANMPLSCRDSGDANGDAVVNIADAVRVLNFLFAEGEPLVGPFPDCGAVPNADCAAGVVCP